MALYSQTTSDVLNAVDQVTPTKYGILDKIIQYSFYLLFLLTPFILTPWNYELFEYNKMMLTYGFTVIIVGFWIIKMLVHGEYKIAKTPFDVPLLLFLFSQIISTIVSIDQHVSIWGYYSRFNGGLLSTTSYILLYYAFVTNFPRVKVKKLLWFILFSAILVSLYGILEHVGIDKDLWVQDVRNRVFSTLGQPNWLAAYLAVLIPLITGIGLDRIIKHEDDKKPNSQNFGIGNLFRKGNFAIWVIVSIFYLTLIFTKSRSGFIGFWAAILAFVILLLCQFKKGILKFLFFVFGLLFFVTFLFGTPFEKINRFTYPELTKTETKSEPTEKSGGESAIIDVGITGSDQIRKIVWNGAIDIFKHYPYFGSGVETFAFSYYKFRPVAHNMTSEWDFLYNKAHNEYLNFAATTGIFGLGSYALFILFFVFWNIIKINGSKNQAKLATSYFLLTTSLFSGWLTILITNFFGFSVVIIQLLFFIIPAISLVLSQNISYVSFFSSSNSNQQTPIRKRSSSPINQLLLIVCVFMIVYLIYRLSIMWSADTVFTTGYHLSRDGQYLDSYKDLKKAISMNEKEPMYYDELSFPAAQLAVALEENKQSTIAAQIRDEAVLASDVAVSISPNNVNFWKSRTRVFFTLYRNDPKYMDLALESLEKARDLSPTDPKIVYNLALIYDKMGKKDLAFKSLDEAASLKPDYRDSYYAKALFFERDKKIAEAKIALEYILTKIDQNDPDAKKKLEELTKSK